MKKPLAIRGFFYLTFLGIICLLLRLRSLGLMRMFLVATLVVYKLFTPLLVVAIFFLLEINEIIPTEIGFSYVTPKPTMVTTH